MRYATHAAIEYAQREHAAINFTTDPDKMARAWNIKFIPGNHNSASAGPPAIITLARDTYAPRQRFTVHHEFAHILIQRSGHEKAILKEVSSELSGRHLEAVANHIASLLVMPEPMIEQAFSMFGLHPETVLLLQKISGVSLAAALRRFTYASGEDRLTTFMVAGSYVHDVASTQDYAPVYRYQRVPDARQSFPDAQLVSLPHVRHARTLGVIVR